MLFLGVLVFFFSLLMWWAIDAGRPPKPRPLNEILAKESSTDTYKPTGEPQKCHKCKAPLGVWYNVMLCDPCLDAQVNNTEAERRRKLLTMINPVKDAPSIDELEKLWNNSK